MGDLGLSEWLRDSGLRDVEAKVSHRKLLE